MDLPAFIPDPILHPEGEFEVFAIRSLNVHESLLDGRPIGMVELRSYVHPTYFLAVYFTAARKSARPEEIKFLKAHRRAWGLASDAYSNGELLHLRARVRIKHQDLRPEERTVHIQMIENLNPNPSFPPKGVSYGH